MQLDKLLLCLEHQEIFIYLFVHSYIHSLIYLFNRFNDKMDSVSLISLIPSLHMDMCWAMAIWHLKLL